ncbi:hypothetical protein MN116_004113 [Schistosoma mekongi]|uniref:Hepatocellular carcinoma-associated antigen 59 n=1 Tax=Schistosoma mekongi TaxID=38744 RepID=A0AAE1ZF29_SCHME|nr:hypothetical protein MN116_004113 [Schistosoma mekongi]
MKFRKARCLRQTTELGSPSDSEEDHPEDSAVTVVSDSTVVVGAIRELQKLRKRPAGISLSALATGKEVPDVNLAIANDPFKLKTGGLVDLNSISSTKQEEEDDDVEARLAKTFATETNKRDEDAEMIRYIEEELAKRKGLTKPSLDRAEDSDLLQDVPEYLKPSIGQQKEDMLSNQMLCGIPEIDLGVEAKMKNIEATEEAKQILLKKRFSRNHSHSTDEIPPINMALNFVQHSRWNSYTDRVSRKANLNNKREINHIASNMHKPEIRKNDISSQVNNRRLDNDRSHIYNEKSTDNIALQRFKNYMRDKRRR